MRVRVPPPAPPSDRRCIPAGRPSLRPPPFHKLGGGVLRGGACFSLSALIATRTIGRATALGDGNGASHIDSAVNAAASTSGWAETSTRRTAAATTSSIAHHSGHPRTLTPK